MSGPGPLRRTLFTALWLVAVVGAADLAQRALRAGWVSAEIPGEVAYWLWDAEAVEESEPRALAVQMARSFELAAGAPEARLLVQGDEEYHLHVNGIWVGGNRYTSGRRWDAYPVGALLRPGPNRLLVQLRSARGVGGLLLCLERAPDEGCLVASDSRWRVFRDYQEPRVPPDLEAGAEPHVWGRAPTGRWPLPTAVSPQPLALSCYDLEEVEPRRVARLPDRVWGDPYGVERRAPVTTVRWPYKYRGMVNVQLEQAGRQVGEVAFGRQRGVPANPATRIELVTQPGQREFRTTRARVLRLIDVTGTEGVAGAWIGRLSDDCEGFLASPWPRDPGLFGLRPPRLRTPVQNEIWGQL